MAPIERLKLNLPPAKTIFTRKQHNHKKVVKKKTLEIYMYPISSCLTGSKKEQSVATGGRKDTLGCQEHCCDSPSYT